MKKRAQLTIDLSALVTAELAAGKKLPTEFRLFGAGVNKTSKGEFIYNERSMRECAAFDAERGIDCVIDYEHASLFAKYAPDPRQAGKAAGFFKTECRADGVFATKVEWTKAGAESLANDEFRYFSPVVDYDENTRELMGIVNCALTNNPAMRGLKRLVASMADDDEDEVPPPTETPPMKTLLAALSLAPTATEAEGVAHVEALKNEKAALLTATGKASLSEALGVVAAWKQGAEQAAVLSAKLAEIESKAKASELSSLIEGAVKEGKVAPAQKAALTAMGEKDLEMLRAFLSAAPKVMPSVVAEPDKGAPSTATLSAEDKQAAALFGISLEDFAKQKAKLAETKS